MSKLNVIPCNAKQIKQVLKMNYELDIPVFIAGPPGIGKTDVVTQFAAEVGAKMPRPIIVSGYQPEDLFGVPIPNRETGYLDYFQLKVLPPSESKEKWVLFFDELSNADRRIQAPLQQFFLHKQLGDYVAPKNCYLIAAGNTTDDACYAYELSRALNDRFCIIELRPDIDSWIEWALAEGVHPDIIAFLKTKPEYLHYELMTDKHKDVEDNRVLPTPRAWGKYVDKYLKTKGYSRTIKEISISGVVGHQIASIFFKVVDELKETPSPQEVIEAARKNKNKLKNLVPRTAVGLWGLSFSLLTYCKEITQYEGLALYLEYLTDLENTSLPIQEVVSFTTERALQNCRKQKLDRNKIVQIFRNLVLKWQTNLKELMHELQN